MWRFASCSILLFIFMLVRCQDSQDFYDNIVFSKGQCNDTFKSPGGGIELKVHNSTDCRWFIEPQLNKTQNAKISLLLVDIFLHESDQITLFKSYEDSNNDNNSIIYPIRANNGSITIVTDEPKLVLKLAGSDLSFHRTFKADYQSVDNPCRFSINEVTTLYAPIHTKTISSDSLNCIYTWAADANKPTVISTFAFEQFNFTSPPNTVSFENSNPKGVYKNDPQMDIFPQENSKTLTITVKMGLNTSETFRLRRRDVDKSCSKHVMISHPSEPFSSPKEVINDGSIVTECRWVFEKTDSKDFSIEFTNIHLQSALDVIAINDGASEFSPPLLQITTSNRNYTMNQLIRSQGPYLWIAFKPVTFGSSISGGVTQHGEGGYYKGSGNIIATVSNENDSVFLLEVESNQIVFLNFTANTLTPTATLSIYDGFDKSNLLATLRGNIWYPVLSQTSKMMIVASGFSGSSFTAAFKGVQPGCLHMSTLSNENYVLSGNCNATCFWIVPPQDRPGSELILSLQYISLLEGDTIDILRLDANKTRIGSIDANVTHIPQLMIPANVGTILEINRASCAKEKEDIVLVGHISYVPACGKNLSVNDLAEFQITSPLYPDTYPMFANCLWKISTPKENIVHLAFNAFNLAPNHCVKVQSSDNTTQQYSGSELPDDLFLTGESTVQFDSSNCGKPAVASTFQSSRGFMVNGTIASCGGALSKNTAGEFSIPANKTFCIWKVSVPETDSNANENVNIISFTVSKKDETGNYELKVYDGSSVREPVIKNGSTSETWSRTSNLIFIYKKIDSSKSSSSLDVKYSTISCNATNQCDNKLCLHPDWRCNGENDCGDFSDERNCASVPVPPPVLEGYSSLAFWLTLFIMLATGVFLGVTVPYCYQRYKNGQYRRFGDFSVVQ